MTVLFYLANCCNVCDVSRFPIRVVVQPISGLAMYIYVI